jgi:hypothetical protein
MSKGINIKVSQERLLSLKEKALKIEDSLDAPDGLNSPKKVKKYLEESVRSKYEWHYNNCRASIGLDWCYKRGVPQATLIKNLRNLTQSIKELEWEGVERGSVTTVYPKVTISKVGRVSYSNPPLNSKSFKTLFEVLQPREGKVYALDILNLVERVYIYLYGTSECKQDLGVSDGDTSGFYEKLMEVVYHKSPPQKGIAMLGMSVWGGDIPDITKMYKAEIVELRYNWLALMNGALLRNLKSVYNNAKNLYDYFKGNISVGTMSADIKVGELRTYYGREIWEDYKVSLEKSNFLKGLMTEEELDIHNSRKGKEKERLYASLSKKVYNLEWGNKCVEELEKIIREQGAGIKKPTIKDISKAMLNRAVGTATDIQAQLIDKMQGGGGIDVYFLLYDVIFLNVIEVSEVYEVVEELKSITKGLGKFNVDLKLIGGNRV